MTIIKVRALKAHDVYRRGDVYERELDYATASLIVKGYLQRVGLDEPGAAGPSMEELQQVREVGTLIAAYVAPAPLANPRRSRAKHPVRPIADPDQLD